MKVALLVPCAVVAAPLAFAACFVNPNPPDPHEQGPDPSSEAVPGDSPDASDDAAVRP